MSVTSKGSKGSKNSKNSKNNSSNGSSNKQQQQPQQPQQPQQQQHTSNNSSSKSSSKAWDLTELNAALVKGESIDKVKSLLRKKPELIRTDDRRVLPLHLACTSSKDESVAVVELLIDLYPDAVMAVDGGGFTPLHYACQNQAPAAVIQALCDTDPACARVKNRAGWLPLFLACGKTGTSPQTVRLLMERYPASLREPFGSARLLALHWACAQRAPLAILELLVQGYPAAISTPTASGMLPLHWACASQAPLPTVIFLTLQYNQGCLVADKGGFYPLHLACHKQAPLAVVQWLVARAPAAIHGKAVATNGHRPLDSAVACGRSTKEVLDFMRYATDDMDPAVLASRVSIQQAIDKYRQEIAPWGSSGGSGSKNGNGSSKNANSKQLRQEARRHVRFLESLVDLVPEHTAAADLDSVKVNVVIEKAERSRPFQAIEVSLQYLEGSLLGGAAAEEPDLSCSFFGRLVVGHDADLHCTFSVKLINPKLIGDVISTHCEQVGSSFATELAKLQKFRHPNIASVYAYHWSFQSQYVLYEWAGKGTLGRFFKSNLGRQRLSWKRRAQVALEMAVALSFLHDKQCCHREVKSTNILLRRDMTAILVGCGLSQCIPPSDEAVEFTAVSVANASDGCVGYMCPAYLNRQQSTYAPACDVYSLGIVLAELWTGHSTDTAGAPLDFGTVFEGKVPAVVQHLDASVDPRHDNDNEDGDGQDLPAYMQAFAETILACLQPKVEQRPTAAALRTKLQSIYDSCIRDVNNHGTTILDVVSAGIMKDKTTTATCTTCCATEVPCLERDGRLQCADCVALRLRAARIPEPLEASKASDFAMHPSIAANLKRLESSAGSMTLICPRLFVVQQAAVQSWEDPTAWMCSHVHKRLHLYFVCAQTLELVDPPLVVRVNREWMDTILVALAVNVAMLQSFNLVGQNTTITSASLQSMHEEMKRLLTPADAALVERLRVGGSSNSSSGSSSQLTDEDVQRLDQGPYQYVEEKAVDQTAWLSRMHVVTKDDVTFWVKKKG